jgi:SAM-dependent methyltransferase
LGSPICASTVCKTLSLILTKRTLYLKVYDYISNYDAPVAKLLEEGIIVLDTGCGPGTWAFEMAETYPRSEFHGIDVSCVFPEAIRPANVQLVVGNIAKSIPYPDNTFDYIHQRLLMAGLTSEDWGNVRTRNLFLPDAFIDILNQIHNKITNRCCKNYTVF